MRLILVLSLIPAIVGAQRLRPIRLVGPIVASSHEFTTVTSLRELSDGRVIATDGREQRIMVIDFARDSAWEIGRRGNGPLEAPVVGFVYATTGDSSIMWSVAGRRGLDLFGARIVGTRSPDDAALVASRGIARGADDRGHVMRLFDPPTRNGATIISKRDSSAVVFIDRASGRVDTVARVRPVPRRIVASVDAAGVVNSMSSTLSSPFPESEAALLFRDGWLAIARLEPFRIDWRSPEGKWTYGRPLPVDLVKVDAAERKAYLRRAVASGRPGAGVVDEWPETLPPFRNVPGDMIAAPDGSLILRRFPAAALPGNRYVVVDRAGNLRGEITLTDRQAIVGSGVRSVYILEKDEDDIGHLSRRAWP